RHEEIMESKLEALKLVNDKTRKRKEERKAPEVQVKVHAKQPTATKHDEKAVTVLASPEPKAPTKQTKRAADTPKPPNLRQNRFQAVPSMRCVARHNPGALKDKTTARPAQIPKVQRLLNFPSLDQAVSTPTPSTPASFAQSTPIKASAVWTIPTSASSISSSSAQSMPIKGPSLWCPPTPASLIPSLSAQSTASKAPLLLAPPTKALCTAGLSV
ncbi:MAG: hypothetical protein L6R35_007462, partial [Caloplaca aegaea]